MPGRVLKLAAGPTDWRSMVVFATVVDSRFQDEDMTMLDKHGELCMGRSGTTEAN